MDNHYGPQEGPHLQQGSPEQQQQFQQYQRQQFHIAQQQMAQQQMAQQQMGQQQMGPQPQSQPQPQPPQVPQQQMPMHRGMGNHPMFAGGNSGPVTGQTPSSEGASAAGHSQGNEQGNEQVLANKKLLNAYIFDFLLKSNLSSSADSFAKEADMDPKHNHATETSPPGQFKPQYDTAQGFLYEWWQLFWDLFNIKSNRDGSEIAQMYYQIINGQRQQEQVQRNVAIQAAKTQYIAERRGEYRSESIEPLELVQMLSRLPMAQQQKPGPLPQGHPGYIPAMQARQASMQGGPPMTKQQQKKQQIQQQQMMMRQQQMMQQQQQQQQHPRSFSTNGSPMVPYPQQPAEFDPSMNNAPFANPQGNVPGHMPNPDDIPYQYEEQYQMGGIPENAVKQQAAAWGQPDQMMNQQRPGMPSHFSNVSTPGAMAKTPNTPAAAMVTGAGPTATATKASGPAKRKASNAKDKPKQARQSSKRKRSTNAAAAAAAAAATATSNNNNNTSTPTTSSQNSNSGPNSSSNTVGTPADTKHTPNFTFIENNGVQNNTPRSGKRLNKRAQSAIQLASGVSDPNSPKTVPGQNVFSAEQSTNKKDMLPPNGVSPHVIYSPQYNKINQIAGTRNAKTEVGTPDQTPAAPATKKQTRRKSTTSLNNKALTSVGGSGAATTATEPKNGGPQGKTKVSPKFSNSEPVTPIYTATTTSGSNSAKQANSLLSTVEEQPVDANLTNAKGKKKKSTRAAKGTKQQREDAGHHPTTKKSPAGNTDTLSQPEKDPMLRNADASQTISGADNGAYSMFGNDIADDDMLFMNTIIDNDKDHFPMDMDMNMNMNMNMGVDMLGDDMASGNHNNAHDKMKHKPSDDVENTDAGLGNDEEFPFSSWS